MIGVCKKCGGPTEASWSSFCDDCYCKSMSEKYNSPESRSEREHNAWVESAGGSAGGVYGEAYDYFDDGEDY